MKNRRKINGGGCQKEEKSYANARHRETKEEKRNIKNESEKNWKKTRKREKKNEKEKEINNTEKNITDKRKNRQKNIKTTKKNTLKGRREEKKITHKGEQKVYNRSDHNRRDVEHPPLTSQKQQTKYNC